MNHDPPEPDEEEGDPLQHFQAVRFGLTVDKRITTGSAARHFAVFELIGPRVADAWPAIRDLDGFYKNSHQLTTATNPKHPDYGQTRIWLESVWCEKEPS